ncbi:integrase [Halodesulfurarchaeum formicicum]|uniref:Integrase n=1 Tax=Halodesulfurarchaeum formicicum TaxID=1873524 RepID=A0A1D8S5V4_9EURY|nr:integrase [Halodesulfurarchaeum formicicum]
MAHSFDIYRLTRPYYADESPHGRSRDKCEATTNAHASKCPSSVSPHAIRRRSITAHWNGNIPKDVASDRMGVSGVVLDKHHDMAAPKESKNEDRSSLIKSGTLHSKM